MEIHRDQLQTERLIELKDDSNEFTSFGQTQCSAQNWHDLLVLQKACQITYLDDLFCICDFCGGTLGIFVEMQEL